MAETHEKPPAALPNTTVGDRDIDTGTLYKFIIGLLAVVLVAMAVMWGLSVLLKKELISSDPALSPLPEANVKRLPPEPRLEVSPPKDLKELREREDAILNGWAWVNKEKGLVQIPVARAAELIAEKGLFSPPPATPVGAEGNPAKKGKKGTKETRKAQATEGGR